MVIKLLQQLETRLGEAGCPTKLFKLGEIMEQCDYCGTTASFYSKQNKKWRCVERVQNCPTIKATMAAKLQVSQKKLKPKSIEYAGQDSCSYGCGEVAKWMLLGTNQGARLCCVEKYQGCPGARSRRSELMTEKYQDANVKDHFMSALRATNQERHGFDYPGQMPGWAEKYKATVQERYGVDHISHTKEFKDLCRSVEFRKKCTKAGYKSKPYLLPSGTTIMVQGYEPRAIDELLTIWSEDDLLFGFDVPTFEYEFDGFTRTYYPDAFIKTTNTIVEVKSGYTYKADLEKNLLKGAAVEAAGYEYKLMIYEGR